MTAHPAHGAVLLLIDLQQAIDHPSWGRRNNPRAEENLARLLAAWRAAGWPVWHVRHDSREAASHYRPGQPGNDFRPSTAPLPGEKVIAKQTNSAFIGTPLEADLRKLTDGRVVVAGVITNNSVEDACFTFDRKDFAGVLRTAEDVHAMSLANLDGEYCRVLTTEALLGPALRLK